MKTKKTFKGLKVFNYFDAGSSGDLTQMVTEVAGLKNILLSQLSVCRQRVFFNKAELKMDRP